MRNHELKERNAKILFGGANLLFLTLSELSCRSGLVSSEMGLLLFLVMNGGLFSAAHSIGKKNRVVENLAMKALDGVSRFFPSNAVKDRETVQSLKFINGVENIVVGGDVMYTEACRLSNQIFR